jgi:hypothetical protein
LDETLPYSEAVETLAYWDDEDQTENTNDEDEDADDILPVSRGFFLTLLYNLCHNHIHAVSIINDISNHLHLISNS